MKVRTERVVINDQYGHSEFDHHTYIANDGKEFAFERDCINYERKTAATEAIAHMPRRTAQFDLWEDDHGSYEDWFYIASVDDASALQQYVKHVSLSSYPYRVDVAMSNYDKRDYVGNWVSYKVTWEDWGEEGSAYVVEFTTYAALDERLTAQLEQFNKLKSVLGGALSGKGDEQ